MNLFTWLVRPAPVKAVPFNVEEFNSDFKDVASRMNGSEGSRATNDWVDKDYFIRIFYYAVFAGKQDGLSRNNR